MATDSPLAFFSYCRADSEFALRLAEDLKAAGANVWLDQLDIEPGAPWDHAVEEALSSSSRLLVILSPVSAKSENVRDEVSFALNRQKRVIPIVYRECDIPFRLARLQQIDFTANYDRGLKILLKALGVEQRAAAAGSIGLRENQPDLSEAEERGRAAEQERLVEARNQAAQRERLKREEPDRETAAEQARLEQERRQAAEKARLVVQERAQARGTLLSHLGRQGRITPPDEIGRVRLSRWWRVVGGLSMNLAMGTLAAWMVFVSPLQKQFHWSQTATSMAFTIAVIVALENLEMSERARFILLP